MPRIEKRRSRHRCDRRHIRGDLISDSDFDVHYRTSSKKVRAHKGPSLHASSASPRSIVHQETAQLLTAAGMTQLAQRLGFYLTDPLAGDIELLTHLFERVVGVHIDAETHAQHLGLARRQLR